MKFKLVFNERCSFDKWSERNIRLRNGRIVTTVKRDTCDDQMNIDVTAELLHKLQSFGILHSNLRDNPTIPGPKLSINFNMETLCNDSIEGYLSVNQLENFILAFSNNPGCLITLEVSVYSITVTSDQVPYGCRTPVNVKLTLDPQRYCFNLKRSEPGPCQLISFKAIIERNGGQDSFHDIWRNNECHPEVVILMALLFESDDGLDPDVPDHLAINKKMLYDGLLADVSIIAGNEAEIKCHRSVLAAHSPVFAAMFQPENGMTEAQTGILKMDQLAEESVRAFLDYLYVWKSKAAEENPSICIDLLEAGHKYDIKPLEKCMEKILLNKPEDWFTEDSCIRLIVYLKNIDLKELNTRAMKLFESKYGDVNKLKAFQEIVRGNTEMVEVAMELIATAKAAD